MKTAIKQQIYNFALDHWYNGLLLWEYAKSDYFGFHASRNVVGRFLQALLCPKTLDPTLMSLDQVNSVLLHDKEVDEALQKLCRLALVPHCERTKNWDAHRAFSFIISHGTRDSAVLDMGASINDRVLPWLYQFGYRDLHGCDLLFDHPFRRGSIRYCRQNLESTNYETARFNFITCLSVIEHGVDVSRYLQEAYRILEPGGYLITSTDYWCEEIVAHGLQAYGNPVRILSPIDVYRILDLAVEHGFKLVGDLDLRCAEPVVCWQRMGLQFTFLFFILKRGDR